MPIVHKVQKAWDRSSILHEFSVTSLQVGEMFIKHSFFIDEIEKNRCCLRNFLVLSSWNHYGVLEMLSSQNHMSEPMKLQNYSFLAAYCFSLLLTYFLVYPPQSQVSLHSFLQCSKVCSSPTQEFFHCLQWSYLQTNAPAWTGVLAQHWAKACKASVFHPGMTHLHFWCG